MKIDRSGWVIDEVRPRSIAAMILGSHYLHQMPAIVPCAMSLTVDGWIKGALVWAVPPKETNQRYGCETWELARLWLSDELPKNSETWFIAKAVRHVRQAHREIGCLVSYADPSVGHRGTIYYAANWLYEGMTDSDRKTPRWDYLYGMKRLGRSGRGDGRVARQPKHRFIYRLR